MTKTNYIISKYYIQTDLTKFNTTIQNSTWLPFIEIIVYNRPPSSTTNNNPVAYTEEFIILLIYFKWLKYNTTLFYGINLNSKNDKSNFSKYLGKLDSAVGSRCLKNNINFLLGMYPEMKKNNDTSTTMYSLDISGNYIWWAF